MKLRIVIILSIVLLLLVIAYNFYFPTQTSGYYCENCNIVLISIDSLRPDHMGIYGYDKNTTPNLDKFASQSILFKNYVAQAYLTPISEFSLQTSLYPHENGEAVPNLFGQKFGLQNPPEMLAQILKVYNYTTIGITSSPEFSAFQDFKNGFDNFTVSNAGSRNVPKINATLLQGLKDKKFFLWIAIGTVHAPYGSAVPESIKSKFINNTYDGVLKNSSLSLIDINFMYNSSLYPYWVDNQDNFWRNYSEPPVKMNQADFNYILSNYDSGINYVDDYVGNFTQSLKDAGLDKNTIVIIESPHGEAFGEHVYVMHYDVYETETHVPLIIRNPKLPPKVIDTQAQSIDILPTILDFLNLTPYARAQGNSLVPLILGKASADFNKYVFIERVPLWEEFWVFAPLPVHTDFAIRTNDWKLIYRPNAIWETNNSWYANVTGEKIQVPEYELYNIKNDPMEQHNLYSERPDIANQLKSQLSIYVNNISNQDLVFNRTQLNPQQIIPYP